MRYQPPHAQIFSGRQTATVCNRLLSSLSAHDFSLLEAQLEPVPLPVRTRLIEPNTPIEHVYFIEEGIASVVAATAQGRRIRRFSPSPRSPVISAAAAWSAT